MTRDFVLVHEPGTADRSPYRLKRSGTEEVACVNGFLDDLALRGFSPKTLRSYGYSLLDASRWAFACGKDLLSLREEDLRDYVRFQKSRRPTAVATINHRLSVLSALVDETSAWWPRDFYTGASPRGFRIEAKLGGRMYEDWGGGDGLVWGVVIGIRQNELLQISGELRAEFGGPSRALHTFRLTPDGRRTLLRFSDVAYGAISDATSRSLEDGWKVLLEGGVKAHVEGRAKS